jgi:hypothetical protein
VQILVSFKEEEVVALATPTVDPGVNQVVVVDMALQAKMDIAEEAVNQVSVQVAASILTATCEFLNLVLVVEVVEMITISGITPRVAKEATVVEEYFLMLATHSQSLDWYRPTEALDKVIPLQAVEIQTAMVPQQQVAGTGLDLEAVELAAASFYAVLSSILALIA